MITPNSFLKNGINNLLNNNAPAELSELVTSCTSYDDLIQKLEKNPSQLYAVFKNLKLESNDPFVTKLASRLASRLLVRLNADDLARPEVKKVETVLRNRGMLDRHLEPDIMFKKKEVGPPIISHKIMAHKAILALESPYFRTMSGFVDLQKGKLALKDENLGVAPEAYQIVMDYLYLSDEKRKNFLSTVDKSLLTHIAKLADYWLINELKERCDEELCNSIEDFVLEKKVIDDCKKESILFPKFVQLLDFINREAVDKDMESIIEEMHTLEGAARLAAKCTPDEIKAFATLKSAFGQACTIPPGTFGKDEWEKTYPITIVGDIPPLPPNIYAILEQEDPYDPGKKLKDTCILFLRPEKVILHKDDGDKELKLGIDGMEELAKNATNPDRRAKFNYFEKNKFDLDREPVEACEWVLMRKKAIPGIEELHIMIDKLVLKGNFQIPTFMDAFILNFITYACEGEDFHGIKTVSEYRTSSTKMAIKITVNKLYDHTLLFGLYLGFDPAVGVWKF